MARNNNRPSNNNRRARNNMSSFIPQARQSIQDNPLREVNLKNVNTRIETNNGDFNWALLGNEPEQPPESFWAQVARINNDTCIQDPNTAFRASSDIEDRVFNILGPDGNNYWMSIRELEARQNLERQTQELLASRMFSEQLALGRNLSVDMEALEELEKIYGERMDNLIIIENDSSSLMPWIRESQGWGRGYVIVRKSSYLYHVPLQEIATLFDVHGGITCQSIISPMDIESWGKYLHLTDEDLDHLILGFDTSHHNNEGFKTREQVLEETRKLQLQIASYG